MKRHYKNKPINDDVEYFVGNEVEKTPFYGRRTLFVVGLKNPKKINIQAKKFTCERTNGFPKQVNLFLDSKTMVIPQ